MARQADKQTEEIRINVGVPGYQLSEGIDSDSGGHEHDDPGQPASVRRFESDLGVVEIETRYTVRINGKLFPDPLHVAEDGSVHYHGLPQYSSPSAVQLMKQIVRRMRPGSTPQLLTPAEREVD